MARVDRQAAGIRQRIGSPLASILHLDKILLSYGANPKRSPSDYFGEWPDHLMWAVDSAVAAVRLLYVGQYVGAATVARNQMERWLLHRAKNASLEQKSGEKTIDFIGRVWSVDDFYSQNWTAEFETESPEISEPGAGEKPVGDHKHVLLTDGSEVCPPVVYGILSELMHGRDLIDSLAWEGVDLLDPSSVPSDLGAAIGAVGDALSLCLRQVRSSLLAIAADRNDNSAIALLTMPLERYGLADEFHSPDDQHSVRPSDRKEQNLAQVASPQVALLAPLTPGEGLDRDFIGGMESMAHSYQEVLAGRRPAGRLFRDDEIATLGFAWHRSRSVAAARSALVREQKSIGDSFDEGSLDRRSVRWIVLAEALSLASGWVEVPSQRNALLVLGSSIRSAYWLWLEDDDRAMAVLRCVLEQAARVRTWRLKPEKAERLEGRETTTPRDWLEAAGWKRLSPLNLALGEFAHTKASSKWSAARDLLGAFQIDADPKVAIYTARGAALEFLVSLVAEELIEIVEERSPEMIGAFTAAFEHLKLLPENRSAEVEEQFNHIWSLRTRRLVDSDFVEV